MRKAIFSILAIMTIAVGITALGSTASAKYVYSAPCECTDSSGNS
jgi:hypothetical protein